MSGEEDFVKAEEYKAPKFSLIPTDEYKSIKKRLDRSDNILLIFTIVMFLGFSTMFVTVAAMIRDQWNSKEVAYKEYSDTLHDFMNQYSQPEKQILSDPVLNQKPPVKK